MYLYAKLTLHIQFFKVLFIAEHKTNSDKSK